MTNQEKDEMTAEYGTNLPDGVTNEQAEFALKNFNYLKFLMMGAKKNETLRDNKRA